MRQEEFVVESNRHEGAGLYRLQLAGNTEGLYADGQFVNLSIPGKYLRRPFSVYRVVSERMTLIYKVAGAGTAIMADLAPGATVDVLVGLGQGYDASRAGKRPLLVGGGYGSASLYGLARNLALDGHEPSVILGFDSLREAVTLDDFIGLLPFGASVQLATRDGSGGRQGLVTDLIPPEDQNDHTFLYACGPMAMLSAVAEATAGIPGQVSLEARMGCGFGACMGCSIQTANGAKRVCKEGPVFDKGELTWTQL